MIIIVHSPRYTVTFSKCEWLSPCFVNVSNPIGTWVRFKGVNDMGKTVVVTTTLPVEIHETTEV